MRNVTLKSVMEPKVPDMQEMPEVVEFLNKTLRPHSTWSISDEYPLVFQEPNRQNLRVIKSDSKIVAHAAVKYHIVKNVVGLFKVAAIGSVVTSPDFRNQGLSQGILNSCLEAAKREGADFAILWTDLYDFYRKLNFELAGHEVSLILEEQIEPPIPPGTRYMCTTKVDPEVVAKLYSQHTVGTIRTPEDIRRFLAIPNTKMYTAWDAEGRLKAYAVEGKGVDLNGYLHEWGGSVPDLLALFAHIRREQNRTIVVIAPSNAQNLIRQLRDMNVIYNEGFLGMVRILHHENLFAKIQRYAKSLGVTDFVLDKQGDDYFIGRGTKALKTNDIKDVTRLLFGPYDFTENVSILNPILPIPMWIWGWDSV